MKVKQNLKPCPFCANEVENREGPGNLGYIVCRNCNAVVSFGEDFNPEQWNRRAGL